MESDPFAPGAIEGLFFPGGGRDELLQSAKHVARFSNQAVVFYGPDGVGKTRLLEALSIAVEDEAQILRMQAGFMSTAEQLFTEVAQAAGMSAVNFIPAAFAEQLGRELASADERKPLILMIDDAHELIDQTLAALLDLAEAKVEKLRILLFAATDGNGFLRAELDRGDVQQLAVQPLDEAAMREYIAYRLNTAGFDRDYPFTDADLASIFKQSLGIPLRVGRVAEQKLRQKIRLSGLMNNPDFSDQSHHVPVLHVVLAICLLAFIALGWLFMGDDEAGTENIVATGELKREPAADSPFKPETTEEAKEGEVPIADKPAGDKDAAKQAELEAKLATARELAAKKAAERKAEEEQKRKLAEQEARKKAQLAAEEERKAKALAAAKAAKKAQEESAAKAAAEKKARERAAAAQAAREREQRLAREKELAAKKAEEKTKQQAVAVEERNGSYAGLTADERALMQVPGGQFTLQLVASSSKSGMDGFLKQYSRVPIKVFRRVRAGKVWYVATTGAYVNKNAAAQGVSSLPPALAKQKPWAKPLSQVHDEIRAARREL
jgi:type II secretory pathway predicted ATPase ExeA